MAQVVYIEAFDSSPLLAVSEIGSTFDNAWRNSDENRCGIPDVEATKMAKDLFGKELRLSGLRKPEMRTRTEEVTGQTYRKGYGLYGQLVEDTYTRTIEVESRIFPEGSTVEDISQKIYGSDVGVPLIKGANALRFKELFGFDGPVLAAGQFIDCPEYVASADATPETDADSLAARAISGIGQRVNGPLERLAYNIQSIPPLFIKTERAHMQKLAGETGYTVVIFSRPTSLSDRSGSPRVIEGVTNLSVRDSLFEGARVLKFKIPYDAEVYNADLDTVHLAGNHVAVYLEGQPAFFGMLITPKMDTKKGSTLQWTAMSHSYRMIKSHFNPLIFKNEWSNMAPIKAISELSHSHDHPIYIAKAEYDDLSKPYKDDDGLENMAADIRGTTPFKFIQKLVSSIGRFLHPTVEGFLAVEPVSLNREPLCLITDGVSSPDMPTVSGVFSVEYNFDELAGTYSVMSQRRDSECIQTIAIEPFPIPGLFKNIVRDNAAPLLLERTATLAGSSADTSPPPKTLSGNYETGIAAELKASDKQKYENKVRRSSGAAIFEVSKAMANAIKIDVEVPGWTDPNGQLWRTNTAVEARSPRHRIGLYSCTISSVDYRGTGKKKSTNLSLTLNGLFDSVLPVNVPFLFRRGEGVAYKEQDYEEALANAEALNSTGATEDEI